MLSSKSFDELAARIGQAIENMRLYFAGEPLASPVQL